MLFFHFFKETFGSFRQVKPIDFRKNVYWFQLIIKVAFGVFL